jgi:hypothetical protein
MLLICPSRSSTPSVGCLIGKSHKVWRWFWNKAHSTIYHVRPNGKTEDVYVSERKPNRFSYSHSQQLQEHGAICSVQPTLEGEHWRLLTMAMSTAQIPVPSLFLEMLQSWGHTWLWEHMAVYGGFKWLEHAISADTLVAVMDGSYIREIYPNLCSAAFVLECSKGRGRVFGSFLEALLVANAYRGELLGLMAIHLILLSINKINPTQSGCVEVVSDCLGALKRVTYLPPYHIPSRCCHLDMLKTIKVHCRSLLFTTHYLHIKAHQVDHKSLSKLSRKAQLNCICNHAAKQWIAADGLGNTTTCRMFLLEPIGLFVGGQKMTSETGEHICFWAHLQLAHKYYSDHKLLSFKQFDLVDWKSIHRALHGLPRLFQLWASKHVLGIAGTMKFLAYQDKRSPLCPSCLECKVRCRHIARCAEEGCAIAFSQSTQKINWWIEANHTHPDLLIILLNYFRGQASIALSVWKPQPPYHFPRLHGITRHHRLGRVHYRDGILQTASNSKRSIAQLQIIPEHCAVDHQAHHATIIGHTNPMDIPVRPGTRPHDGYINIGT